ncbi:MAG: metallophosphoesterase [Myxococcota bacterium]|nr:metallophosphoesterase [Myxococcota bacterium]
MLFLLFGCSPPPTDAHPIGIEPHSVPEVLSLSWSSPYVTTDEALSVHISSQNALDLQIDWTINGTLLEAEGITLDGRRHFDRGDLVSVAVTPIDYRMSGETVTLGPLEIANSPPGAPTVQLVPESPIAAIDPVVCLGMSTDPDGDPTTLRYSWTHDGSEISTSSVLYPQEVLAGMLTCRVWAQDGTDEGSEGMALTSVRDLTPADLDPFIQPDIYITPQDLTGVESITVHYTGELLKSSMLSLRYGVDGKFNHESIELEQLTSSLMFTRDVEMEWIDEEWQVEVVLPADVTAIHMSFFNQDGMLDDRSGLEYHRSRTFPYIPPYLTWNDSVSPDDGIIVSYATDIECLGVVAFGTDPDDLSELRVGGVYDTLHHIALTELEPETTYYYTVHDSAGHESDVYHFTTTPEEFSAYTLLVMADLQDNGTVDERWPEVAATIADNHTEIDLILMPGDMTADDYPGYWWLLFEGGKELFPYIQMLPVLGNHDTPTGGSSADYTSFARYFELPRSGGDEAYYGQDYGNSRFLNFNSEVPEDFSEKGAQVQWAEEEIAMLWDGADPLYDWVFAAWHSPVYNVGGRFAMNQYSFRPITSVLDGHVDWVFTAHEHIYQRYLPITYSDTLAASGDYGVMSDDGVGYIVVPAGGNRLRDMVVAEDATGGEVRDLLAYPTLTEDQITVDAEHGYIIVDINGPTMNMNVWGIGDSDLALAPHVRDSVNYTKP